MVGDRITIGGLASGLDTNLIIDALLRAGERPIVLAQQRLGEYERRREAFSLVNTSLAALLTSLDPLQKRDVFAGRITSVVSSIADQGAVDASVAIDSAIGSFSVKVLGLATASVAQSTTAMSDVLDVNVSLNQSRFDQPFVAGTFTVGSTEFTIPDATATTLVGAAAIGPGVDPNTELDAAGLTIAIDASGTFDINGITISYDAAADSLTDVMNRINSSNAGVSATFDVATDKVTLTRTETGPATIAVSDTTGNFLEAIQIVDGVNAKIGVETAGADVITFQQVIDMINLIPGLTATIVDAGTGRLNYLEIDGGGPGDLVLGAGSDTSNFLAVTHLLESPAGTNRTSIQGMSVTEVTANMDVAGFPAVPALTASGTFEINGVSIDYDAATESLLNIMTKINASAAGVTASYDARTDTMILTASQTGSSTITLLDTTGNFLSKTGVLGNVTVGVSATYQLNDDVGTTYYSSSNTITSAQPGVTLEFTKVSADFLDVSITHDTTAASASVMTVVEKYNEFIDLVDQLTEYDEDGPNGLLFGDSTLRTITRQMRSVLSGSAFGALAGDPRTFAEAGLDFGAFGAAVGTTDRLVFDQGKFEQLLKDDPQGVIDLFNSFDATAVLDGGGTGSLLSISGTPTSTPDSGTYMIVSKANGDLTITYTPDDGSGAVVSSATITAGGTNSTAIPGITLTAAAVLVDGTDTITIAASREGLGKQLHELVDYYTRTGGIIDGRDNEFQANIDSTNDQIDKLQARLAAKEEQLIRRFTALELTIARLQSQGDALSGMIAQLNANRRQR